MPTLFDIIGNINPLSTIKETAGNVLEGQSLSGTIELIKSGNTQGIAQKAVNDVKIAFQQNLNTQSAKEIQKVGEAETDKIDTAFEKLQNSNKKDVEDYVKAARENQQLTEEFYGNDQGGENLSLYSKEIDENIIRIQQNDGLVIALKSEPKRIRSLKDFLTSQAQKEVQKRGEQVIPGGFLKTEEFFSKEFMPIPGEEGYDPRNPEISENSLSIGSEIFDIKNLTDYHLTKVPNINPFNSILSGVELSTSIIKDFAGIQKDKNGREIIVGKQISVFDNFVRADSVERKIFKGFAKRKTKEGEYENDNVNTPGTKEYLAKYNSEINQFAGTYRFFIEQLHGRDMSKNPYKKNPVLAPGAQKSIIGNYNFSNRMIFPAFVDAFNTSFDVNSEDYSFLGRAEGVPVYKSTSRTILLTFHIISDFETSLLASTKKLLDLEKEYKGNIDYLMKDLTIKDGKIDWGNGTMTGDMRGKNSFPSNIGGNYFESTETAWQKLTFLSQCCYPYFRSDGKMKEQPMVRLRLGDFLDVTCMIKNLQFETNPFDAPLMTLRDSYLGEQPMGYKVTMSLNIYHDFEPSSEYHGFFHRKQFDNDPDFYKRNFGVGINSKEDSFLKSMNENAEVSDKDSNDKNVSPQNAEIKENVSALKGQVNNANSPNVSFNQKLREQNQKSIYDLKTIIEEGVLDAQKYKFDVPEQQVFQGYEGGQSGGGGGVGVSYD